MPKLLLKNALTKSWFVDKMLILEWGTWRENADLLTICGKVVGENEEILWGWGIYWQLLGKKWEICWFLAQIFPTFSLSSTRNPAPKLPYGFLSRFLFLILHSLSLTVTWLGYFLRIVRERGGTPYCLESVMQYISLRRPMDARMQGHTKWKDNFGLVIPNVWQFSGCRTADT